MDKETREFETLLREKRHKELITLLTVILEKIPTDLNIENNVDLSNIEKMMSKLNKPVKKEDSKVPESIKMIGETIIKKIEDIKKDPTPKEWTFNIKRNNNGLIQVVKAKATK